MRRTVALAALLVSLVACGERDEVDTSFAGPGEGATASPSAPSPAPSSEPIEPGGLTSPPPVTVHYSDQSAELHAWTYCYANGCADGAPPKDLIDVGSPEEVTVEFPLPEWSFSAEFQPADEKCGRIQTVPLERTGDTEFVLRPAGFAGTYEVTLVGRGDGDLFTTFVWTTPSDGPLPEPKARLAVLAGGPNDLQSYGVEMELRHLERTPKEVAAEITVEAADGKSITFAATRAGGQCFHEGTVYFNGPDDEGIAATQLGEAPFTYTVRLTLDGERHVASAVWPDDEIAGNEPSVRLEFDPPLPALS